jgi:hypothetical protein
MGSDDCIDMGNSTALFATTNDFGFLKEKENKKEEKNKFKAY